MVHSTTPATTVIILIAIIIIIYYTQVNPAQSIIHFIHKVYQFLKD